MSEVDKNVPSWKCWLFTTMKNLAQFGTRNIDQVMKVVNLGGCIPTLKRKESTAIPLGASKASSKEPTLVL